MEKYTSAVIVAAGGSSRMKGVDKILLKIKDKPLIYYTVRAFEAADCINEIIIVTQKEKIPALRQALAEFKKIKGIYEGGSCRTQSAYRGFERLSGQSRFIAVHDGARPFIKPEDINAVVAEAHRVGAACCGCPVTDTIKELDEKGFIASTPDRSKLFAAATPQVFSVEIYEKAISRALSAPECFTDDASMVEALGIKVKSVLCEGNSKVTSPRDVLLARLLLEDAQQSL